jgi:hypothetical protein
MSRTRATPERLSAFSDAVFAVLITVLVLDLQPPELPTFKGRRSPSPSMPPATAMQHAGAACVSRGYFSG